MTSAGLELLRTQGLAQDFKLQTFEKAQKHQGPHSLSDMNLRVLSHLEHKTAQMTLS